MEDIINRFKSKNDGNVSSDGETEEMLYKL